MIKTKKNTNKKLSLKLHSHSQTISILSYNVSWESMTGSNNKWMLCNNNTNINNPRHNSVCIRNIADVINNNSNNLDFITLQEVGDNYNKLINQSQKLKDMDY